jgi:hypothetical protein
MQLIVLRSRCFLKGAQKHNSLKTVIPNAKQSALALCKGYAWLEGRFLALRIMSELLPMSVKQFYKGEEVLFAQALVGCGLIGLTDVGEQGQGNFCFVPD